MIHAVIVPGERQRERGVRGGSTVHSLEFQWLLGQRESSCVIVCAQDHMSLDLGRETESKTKTQAALPLGTVMLGARAAPCTPSNGAKASFEWDSVTTRDPD